MDSGGAGMSEFDERISKAYDLIERYGRSESDIHYETGLDADDCFRDLMVYVKGLVARIAELEAENAMLKQPSQPIEFWSDEKIRIYKSSESRTMKSGYEEREA